MFFIQGGIQAFAVYLPEIIKETGFTLAQVALISTIATVVAFATNMSFGFILRKFSAKAILFFGATLCVVNCYIISEARTLFGLYSAAFCAGFAIGFGTVAPVSYVMTNWFVKNRATFMSVVIAGSMFGGAVIMPVAGQLIAHYDWRVANKIIGAAILVVTYTCILGFMSDSPAKKGQKAYGAEEAASGAPGKDSSQAKAPEAASGVDLAQARSSGSFWLLLVGVLLIGCSTNIENFLPHFWRSGGMSTEAAAAIMGLYALITGVCSILLGRVSDKLGGQVYILMTASTFILGAFLIYLVGGAATTPVVIMAIIPFAIGGKKTSTLTPPLVVAETFGRKSYGAIIGYFAGTLQLGIALSNPLIGTLQEYSGGYKLPFTVMGCLSVVALVLVTLALRKAPYKAAKLQKA
jgi:MFS family permease